MRAFDAHPAPFTEMTSSLIGYTKSYALEDPWRWIPSGLIAVLINASEAFTEIFWVIIILWAMDLLIGFTKAWVAEHDALDWMKVFRSVIKLVVIALAVVAMNAIEQLLSHAGLPVEGQLVVSTMFVIGTADALSILSNLTFFWPSLGSLAETIKAALKGVKLELPAEKPDQPPTHPPNGHGGA